MHMQKEQTRVCSFLGFGIDWRLVGGKGILERFGRLDIGSDYGRLRRSLDKNGAVLDIQKLLLSLQESFRLRSIPAPSFINRGEIYFAML